MWIVRMAVAAALLGAASGTAAAQPASCPAGQDAVCIEKGAIRGVVEGETLAFKGIPYAAPPLGPLRWRAPRAPAPWEGVRDGSRHGAMCPQLVGKEVKGEEDCLYLNVWRPRETPVRPLPVGVAHRRWQSFAVRPRLARLRRRRVRRRRARPRRRRLRQL